MPQGFGKGDVVNGELVKNEAFELVELVEEVHGRNSLRGCSDTLHRPFIVLSSLLSYLINAACPACHAPVPTTALNRYLVPYILPPFRRLYLDALISPPSPRPQLLTPTPVPAVPAAEEEDDEGAARRLHEENAAALVCLTREQTFAMRRERNYDVVVESDVESAVEDRPGSAFADPSPASPSLLRAPAGPLPPSLSRARAPGHRASTITLSRRRDALQHPRRRLNRRKQVHTWMPSPGGAMLIPHALGSCSYIHFVGILVVGNIVWYHTFEVYMCLVCLFVISTALY
ncbi:hypothetical protein FA95DRAFT_1609748 [Auriscalpium vulgare]|uniref:Uncharacterized protein n=1 Tax=Auriscalpium vulgare TaxID=40419 RepID=A0ACB8RFZ7_9AGAM|nr:hypothetical protein FA95DRAFT_1609748 [Auriscalpium vulgare]